MSVATAIVILAVLAVVSALLSFLESALGSLREHDLEPLTKAPERPRVRQAVSRALGHPRAAMLAVLIASSVINLGIVAVGLYLIIEHFPRIGVPAIPGALALFGVVVLVSDIGPKLLSLAHPKDSLRRSAWLLHPLQQALAPMARRLEEATDWAVDRLTPHRLQQRSFVTEDELETWVEMRRDLGTLDESESEMIQDIIRLGAKTAKDCMTPRVDCFTLAHECEPELARRIVSDQPHWMVPVYENEPDSIVGVLDVKRFLMDGPNPDFRDHIVPPLFVPETMPALDLFQQRLTRPHDMAVVLDEYGGFEGLVTHADMIEEIMEDAAPAPDHDPEIQSLGCGRLLVSGAARLDELSDALDHNLEADGLDTIGGLIFNTLTYLPDPGTRVVLGNIVATVRKSSPTRIEEILLEKSPPDTLPGSRSDTEEAQEDHGPEDRRKRPGQRPA